VNVIQLILLLVPQIISFIKAAEAAFPGAGAGKQKLDAVTDAVSSVVAAIPEVESHAQAIKSAVAPHVNALVAVFNALGIFKKSTAAARPTAAPASTQASPPAPDAPA
jgi:hypothetical protein